MKRMLIGLSGGINSMAVLCWLSEQKKRPKELHLFYAHFLEHSPDTFQFVADGMRFAKKHFKKVFIKITKNSILDYFRKAKMIPHPATSPCSRILKIEPIAKYCAEHGIEIDLVGYVRHELKRRIARQQAKTTQSQFEIEKQYPIGEFSDEWCFEIVQKHIGWYPRIYDILDENGKPAFKHNNCLPCKNMSTKDFERVKQFYPQNHFRAMQLSAELGKFWGRSETDFYERFGRDLGQQSTCENCKW